MGGDVGDSIGGDVGDGVGDAEPIEVELAELAAFSAKAAFKFVSLCPRRTPNAATVATSAVITSPRHTTKYLVNLSTE